MPYRLFHSSQYDADTVRVMSEVFDEVCAELGLANREERFDSLQFRVEFALEGAITRMMRYIAEL